MLTLDPNDPNDRKTTIENYVIKDQEYLTYRHKFLLVKNLENALARENYDFSRPFEYDYETDEPSSSPWSSEEIITPRSFFEAILNTAKKLWKSDLSKAAAEDQTKW